MKNILFLILFSLSFSLCRSQGVLFNRHYEFRAWTAGWGITVFAKF
jgi:hypothetical protein